MPHIFERFRQVDSTAARSHGGLGLGLAIVRHLVEAHGGSVSVTSEGVGTGASFTLSLPISAVSLPEDAPPPGLYARAEDADRARQAGYKQHIAKPVDSAALVEAVRKWTLGATDS